MTKDQRRYTYVTRRLHDNAIERQSRKNGRWLERYAQLQKRVVQLETDVRYLAARLTQITTEVIEAEEKEES